MKQLEGALPTKPEVEIQAEKKQEYKFIGSIVLNKGMKLYSLNTETFEIKEVEIKRDKLVDISKKDVTKSTAQHDPRLVYIKAINFKNAKKKAEKMLRVVFERSNSTKIHE